MTDPTAMSAVQAPSAGAWYRFARLHLLGLGAVLLAVGVVFFVAANWGDLTPNQRLGIVGGALVASALAGAVLGLSTFSGRLAVLLAGLLFGPLIALYGQIYQTGADAWEIYAIWTLVLAGFAALARLQGGWALWLLLLEFTAWSFTVQSVTQAGMFSAPGLPIVAGLATVYALIIAGLERRARASGQRLVLPIYTATGLGLWTLVGCAAMAILGSGNSGAWSAGYPTRLLAIILALSGLGAIYAVYRKSIPDLLLLASGATGACVLTTVLLGHLLSEAKTEGTVFFLLLGLAICAQVWALATWLLSWRRRQRADERAGTTAEAASTAEAGTVEDALDGDDTGSSDTGSSDTGSSDTGSSDTDTPWFVHLFVGFGTWVGAIVLLVFLGFAGLLDNTTSTVVLGSLLFLGALLLGNQGSTAIFPTQLTWVLTVTGQLCLAIGVGRNDSSAVPFLLALLQVPTLIFVRQKSLRLAAAFALPLCLTWLCAAKEVHPVLVQLLALMIAAVVVTLWWRPKKLALAGATDTSRGNPWHPIGLGLATGLGVPLLTVLHAWPRGQNDIFLPRPVAAIALAALTLAVLARALHGLGISLRQAAPFAAAAGLAAVTLLTMDVPGVGAGLLLLVLGFWRSERWLSTFGLVFFGGFLFDFYYRLDVPLLEKSLWVVGSGFVLLATGVALRRLVAREHEADAPQESRPMAGHPVEGQPMAGPTRTAPQLGTLAALVLIALAIPGWQSYQKQQVVDSGRTVFLELRPIDPRSLMQGDYMVLNYQLHQATGSAESFAERPRRGKLVLHVEENGVAEFVEFWDGSATLQPDQQFLDYRLRLQRWGGGNQLRLGVESFFFEEGRAGFFSNAKYAEVRVSEDGEPVLVGLRGPELQVLGGG